MTNNGIPLSIQEGYDLLLKYGECDMINYMIYKKLALLGYRLLRYSELLRRLSKTTKKTDTNINNSERNDLKKNVPIRKHILNVKNDEFSSKKRKVELETGNLNLGNQKSLPSGSDTNPAQSEFIKDIFEKLQETAPSEYDRKVISDTTPQFCVFLPNNKSRYDYDFNLYIW